MLASTERGEGPLAVFVHGFPLDATMWRPQLDALGDLRRCVAIDLPGFGRSAPRPELNVESLADAVAGAVHDLGEEQADLVGFSMGGFALLALWERTPEVARSLALVGARANADTPEIRARRDQQADLLRREGRAALADAQMPSLVAPGACDAVRAHLRAMIEGTPTDTILAALAALRDRPDRTALLETVTVPALVVGGAEDALSPPALLADAAARLPRGTLRLVPGAGHAVGLEAPTELDAALREFWLA